MATERVQKLPIYLTMNQHEHQFITKARFRIITFWMQQQQTKMVELTRMKI